jgi:hypothetical protein
MPREPFGMTDATALGEQVRATAGPAEPRIGTDEHQAVNWLTRLHLLRGVPFGYLVPDIAMLPSESIRFFQVDAGWIDALIDGAFSIGATRGTAASGAALRTATAPVVRARLHRVRAAIVGPAETSTAESGPAGTSSGPEAISGFLLRSAVVSGWPGLEVRCYADVAGQQPLPLLRLERVAPALLCCLAGGVLQRADLQEPPEGVHFGVDPAPQGSQTPWQKNLRYASGNATVQVGSWIPGKVQPVPLRPGSQTVVQVDALAQGMTPQVWAPPPPSPGQFTAAQFGLEMTEGVQVVSFRLRG